VSELLIRGGQVLTLDDARREGAFDVRVASGRIVEIGSDLPVGQARVLDASGAAVLPGFVQTHIHLCQTLFRNLADDLLLLDWLRERIWPLEAAHTAASLRASAELGIAELLLGGTTAIVDMGTVHHTAEIFEALIAGGMRAIAGKCMMDDPAGPDGLREPTEASLAASIALAERYDGAANGRIRYGFAPRFILSCTPELLAEVGREAAARKLFIHTHSSENTEEIAIVQARAGQRNVLALAASNIRGPHTVLAHCVHLDEAERRELAAAGTRVSHCPSSNLKLGSGIADVPGLLEAGIHVSIGADGAPCNNRLDMWTEMRTAALLQKPRHGPTAMPAELTLELATRRGAEALSRGHELGQVAVGFLADLQVVALDDLFAGPGGSLSSRLVYATERQAVRHVLVDGEVLVEDGRLTRWDRAAIAQRARAELAGCVARAGLGG
jgi:cytosine/adenosine deaminase-related metal-dependent hydrolase